MDKNQSAASSGRATGPRARSAGAVEPAPPQRSRHRPVVVVLLILAALVVLMFGDVLGGGGGVVLSNRQNDLATQYLYWRQFGFEQLKTGEMPLWNPHVFSGVPFVGGFRSAMFYPPNLLFLALPADRAANVSIALHVFLLGLFVYLWSRRRKMSAPAGLLAAVLAMFGAPYFLRIYAGHLCVLSTMVWAPLLLLAADALLAEARLAWVLVGALAAAMLLLAGNLQCAYYTFLALLIYAAANAIGSWRRLRAGGVAQRAGLLLCVVAAGAALAAVQVLTGVEAAEESPRIGGVTREFAGSFSLAPENLLTLLVPGLLGDMTHCAYWGRGFLWEMSLFAGVTGLVLAVVGACQADKTTRRFFALTAVLLLVLALGSHLPSFNLLYAVVPGYDKFRGNSKFVLPASLFLAMLAGMGLDALLRGAKAGRGTLLTLAAGGAALGAAAVVAGVWGGARDGLWSRAMQAVRATGESLFPEAGWADPAFAAGAGTFAAGGLAVAAGTLLLLALLLWIARSRPGALYAVAALGMAEVFVFAAGSRDTFPLADLRPPAIEAFLARHPGEDRILNQYRYNAAIALGAYEVGGYEPGAVRRRYAEFVGFTQGLDLDRLNEFPDPIRQYSPLFSLLRCRYVFEPTEDGTDLRPAQLAVTPLPRLLLVRSARVLEGRDAILAAMNAPSFDPAATVILERPPTPAPDPAGPPGTVTLAHATVNSLTIEADLPAPAVLLITDAYAKSWQARPLPGSVQDRYDLMPADYAFRAVPLAAGKHRLRVEYAPRGYQIGKAVSLAALAAFLAACAWLGTASLRRPRPPL